MLIVLQQQIKGTSNTSTVIKSGWLHVSTLTGSSSGLPVESSHYNITHIIGIILILSDAAILTRYKLDSGHPVVITRRLEFICRRFGTLCLFHLHRQVDVSVPKRRHINSRRRVITQKKAYNIQNKAKA